MLNRFKKFLKENNINPDDFLKLFEPEYNGFTIKRYKSKEEFFRNEPCEKWIYLGFRWDVSNYDYNILFDLNEKWEKLCKEINDKEKGEKIKLFPKWILKLIKK